MFERRREGEKDGPGFVPSRFALEPDGRHVRRLRDRLIARTAVALDIEADKVSGACPPPLDTAVERVRARGWAGILYTSHNHAPSKIRYRLVFPLSAEIDPDLPVVEVIADALGLLGVFDMSKVGASSLFFLPSCEYGAIDQHQTLMLPGDAIDAGWVREHAGALLAARQTKAQAEAAARREAKIAAGFNHDNSLIEKLRLHFDLDSVLCAHGYDKQGGNYAIRIIWLLWGKHQNVRRHRPSI